MRHRRLGRAALTLIGALLLPFLPLFPTARADAQVIALGNFVPLNPARILDTRNGTGGVLGKLGPNASIEVGIAGQGGVPAGATAVLLNVTVTDPTANGFLTVFPDFPIPLTSTLNFIAGQTVANQTLVRVPADGRVRLYNSAGSTNVIFDVAGYYLTGGAGFGPLSPIRIFDSRVNGPKLAPNETRTIQVAGVGGVPTFASAVVLNVTVTEPTQAGHVTLFPTGEALPTASNVNFPAGRTVANLATVRLGVNGAINLTNVGGSAHVIFDVAGFYSAFTPTTTTALPTPVRIVDTRVNFGAGGRLGPNEVRGLQLPSTAGVPANALAVIANVTVVNPSEAGYVVAYPSGEALPNASNVNFLAGETVANLVEVKIGSGGFVLAFNRFGSVDVVIDVVGYVS